MNEINKLINFSSTNSVADLFEAKVKTNPEAIAILNYKGKNYTYKNLQNKILRLSNFLTSYNIKPSSRVVIISENRSEYLELEMACAKIGAIVAAINWRLSEEETQYCIDLVKPKIIFFSERYQEKYYSLKLRSHKYVKFDKKYEKKIMDMPPYKGESIGRGEDPMVILYTSGTTGYPKGAVISHRAFIARAMYNVIEYGIDKEDTFPAWAPMFHMASTDLAIGSLLIGGSVSFIDGFKKNIIINLLKKYKISWLVLMPGMLEDFIKYLKTNTIKPKGIKIMGAMADLIPKKQIAEITQLLCTPYLNSFGSTETGMPPASGGKISINSMKYSLSKTQSSLCEIKFVDDDDREVEIDQPGECILRGPTLFSGYWNEEKINQIEFRNGWFHMGDVMKRNSDGTIDFVDRKKYLIKSGGENIYPAEIERVFLSHKDVIEAVAVKTYSKKWGETPTVLVVTNSHDKFIKIYEDLVKLSRKKLAGYKQPSFIKYFSKENIPRSSTGKVQRHLIEKMIDSNFKG